MYISVTSYIEYTMKCTCHYSIQIKLVPRDFRNKISSTASVPVLKTLVLKMVVQKTAIIGRPIIGDSDYQANTDYRRRFLDPKII